VVLADVVGRVRLAGEDDLHGAPVALRMRASRSGSEKISSAACSR
jgi:hypothetical protein